MLYTDKQTIHDCIVLDSNEKRSRIWVPLWKKIVSVQNSQLIEGSKVILSYYLNFDAPTWKKRIVFRVEDKDFQELQHHEQSSDVGPW
jgi:hypothetical protein